MNVGPQPYIFPNTFDHPQVGNFPLSILFTPIVAHDQTPQPTPIFSIYSQLPLKIFCPVCGHQFTNQRLTHHQHSCQASNSFNPNPCDHLSSIPSFIPTSSASIWIWVLSLDVFESFHLNFHCLWLYNHIPTTLQHDIQMAFCFPLDKITHDPNVVPIWHLFFLLSQWCLALAFHGRATWHKETWVQLECFLTSDWENLLDEFFFNPKFWRQVQIKCLFPQHDPQVHKCIYCNLVFGHVREYSQATCTLVPFSLSPTFSDAT